MEPQFRLAEIEVSRAMTDDKIIGLFRYQTDGTSRKPATLVIVVEIDSSLYVYEQLLDVINATAEQVRVLTIDVDTDPMARFEKLVQRINDAIANFLDHEPTEINWQRVNIFLLQLTDGQVCLTGIGSLTNVFTQKQKDGSYKAFDLLGSVEQPTILNPQKLFASLICGDMAQGDVLFVGTKNFERVRHELDLLDKLKSLPPVTCALEMKQAIEKKGIEEDFAGIIMASVLLPATVVAAPIREETEIKDMSTDSVEQFNQTAEDTQTHLDPRLGSHRSQDILPPRPVKRAFAPTAKAWMTSVSERFKKPAPQAVKTVEQKAIKDPITLVGLRGMNAGHGNQMTMKKKLQLGGFVLGIVIIIGGFRYYQISKQQAADQQLWNAVFSQATDLKTRSDSALLYGNEETARRQIDEAERLLKGLDEKTTDRSSNKQTLMKALEDIRAKLKREVVIEQPIELGSLALGSPANSLRGLGFAHDQVLAYDAAGTALIEINLTTRQVKRVPFALENGVVISSASSSKGFILLTDTKKLFEVVPGQDTPPQALEFAIHKASSTVALAPYNKRLYVLDSVGNMIWRYSQNGTSFGQETAYLKQNSQSLSTANALALDVNAYVGFADGRIKRYLSGAEEVWDVAAVDPPVMQLTALWTDPNSDRLVALDGKRVLVYRKSDGKLVAQITSPQFQQLNNVAVDAINKKIYLIDNNRILVVDLP